MFKGLYGIASMRALALASVFSLFAVSAAQAGDGPPTGPGDGTSRTAALETDRHPIVFAASASGAGGDISRGAKLNNGTSTRFAGDGPGNPGDNNGRAELATDTRMMI